MTMANRRAARKVGSRRQTVSRARRRVHDEHARFDTSAREHARLAAAFGNAIATANPQALIECLSNDVVFYSDGGGKAIAALNPIYGADKVGRFFAGIAKKEQGVFEPRPVTVNGRPGLLLVKDEKPETVLAFAVADGRIAAVYAMRNPDKLARVRL